MRRSSKHKIRKHIYKYNSNKKKKKNTYSILYIATRINYIKKQNIPIHIEDLKEKKKKNLIGIKDRSKKKLRFDSITI